MKTATVRLLRNEFARISQWIEQGESVRITKAGRAFAVLHPYRRGRKGELQWPDFADRLKRMASPAGLEAEAAEAGSS